MPKSKREVNSNDKKILDALMGNARQPLIEISEKTGLSRQTVQKTISRLESEHVIWGYPVIVDEQKKGFSNYLLLIKRNTTPIDENAVDIIISKEFEKLASEKKIKIITSSYCHGNYDWVVNFIAADIIHAKNFVNLINSMFSKYFADLQLLESLFFVKKQGTLNPDVEKLKQFV